MYTKTILTSALVGLAAAVPVSQRQTKDTSFTLISTHSGNTNVHLRPINAAGQRFWLNRDTSTYCPSTITCPSNTDITALVSNNGFASLDTTVPGGQQVYVAPDGALGFTQAHSASAPAGSSFDGFVYTPPVTEGSVGTLSWGGVGFVACPNPVEGAESAYQVYASNTTLTGCTGIGAASSPNSAGAAWQYV